MQNCKNCDDNNNNNKSVYVQITAKKKRKKQRKIGQRLYKNIASKFRLSAKNGTFKQLKPSFFTTLLKKTN